jgi:hypothetical protein
MSQVDQTHRGSLYTDIANAALEWPSHAAITAIGTPRGCISVAQECRASCKHVSVS